jgi:hypothetical protein
MKRLYIILLGLLLLVPLQGQILVHSNYTIGGGGGTVVPPSLLSSDGHTWAWYLYTDSVVQTGNAVRRWGDYLNSTHDLKQTTGGAQPTLVSDGIDFDGTGDYLWTDTIILEQPTNIYIVFKQVTWTDLDYIFEGINTSAGILNQRITDTHIRAYSGTASSTTALSLDTWCIVRVLFNGASSKLQLNGNAAITGNFGANHMDGFTLANSSTTGRPADIVVREIIIRSVDDTDEDEALIYDYLKDKYSL